MGHKAACVLGAAQPNPKEYPDEKAQLKKVDRWISVWSPAMSACLPIALDLANHEWGRHRTHAYVHNPTSMVFF